MEWIKKNKTLMIVLAAFVVVAIVVLSVISYTFSIRNEGERQEQKLMEVYSNSTISLSTCLDQGRIAAQVTEQEFESLKQILVNVSAARYVEAEDGTRTDADEALGGGQMFSAIVENYPTIDQRSWQNLQTVVVGCRDAFQNSQKMVQRKVADYNEWRVTDNIFNTGIKADFPSQELVIQTTDGMTLVGRPALERLARPVTVEAANLSFETGEMVEQDLFGKD